MHAEESIIGQPPDSERFCLSCQRKTTWRYNPVVGHSRCTECGGSYSTKEEVPEEKLQEIARKMMPWINNKS
jgi:hypothetical protein